MELILYIMELMELILYIKSESFYYKQLNFFTSSADIRLKLQ